MSIKFPLPTEEEKKYHNRIKPQSDKLIALEIGICFLMSLT